MIDWLSFLVGLITGAGLLAGVLLYLETKERRKRYGRSADAPTSKP